MNILFFLIPKSDVTYIYDDISVLDALNILENEHYTAIPVINKAGKYIGTLTEGDMLWAIKDEYNLKLNTPESIPISKIPRRKDNEPVRADANMEDMINKAMSQNFVPVIDDNGIFIGIITRKDIIEYCYKHISKHDS